MKTKYLVLTGPHFPPSVRVERTDFCLVAQTGCEMEVLLARTIPQWCVDAGRTEKIEAFLSELGAYAAELGGKVGEERKSALLAKLAEERAVQVNVAQLLVKPKKPAHRPANFGADFGNLFVGEREGSFSPRGRVDGYW